MLGKLTEKKIRDALTTVIHPKTGKDIVASGAIDEIILNKGEVSITMLIDPKTAEIMEGVRKRCDEAVAKLSGVKSVRTVMTAHKAGPIFRSAGPEITRPKPARTAAARSHSRRQAHSGHCQRQRRRW